MNIITIFITGLFAGGLTCLAVQGGLLASSISQSSSDETSQDSYDTILPVFSFLTTRLISYTIVGLVLGALGSVVQLSLSMRVIMQGAVAIFMIGTALNLLHIHPIFRYFVIQPPRFLTRLVKDQSRSKSMFGPALLGAFTVFIPCGATQAMMAYAITTGSPLSGAFTMFAFILGTSPVFFLLGYATKRLEGKTNSNITIVVAVAIILVALYNLNGALALSGSTFYFQQTHVKRTLSNTTTQATIYLTQSGYKTDPTVITVKGGSKVKLNLINQSGSGCIQAFTIPKIGIQQTVPVGTSSSIEFTAPKESGPLAFMCGMGMYRGSINVL